MIYVAEYNISETFKIIHKSKFHITEKSIRKNPHNFYKKIKYFSEGEEKTCFLSVWQINEASKGKFLDMEIWVDGVKRYISFIRFEMYLYENSNLVTEFSD